MKQFGSMNTVALLRVKWRMSPAGGHAYGVPVGFAVVHRVAELLQNNREATLSKAEDVELERLSGLKNSCSFP